MRYQKHIDQFVSKIQKELGEDLFDWIETPEGENIGLNEVDEENLNPALFEIKAGLHTGTLDEEEVNKVHSDIEDFADREKVSVEISEANPDSCVYLFSLHSRFLDVNR